MYVTQGPPRLGIEGQPVHTVGAGNGFFEPEGAFHTVAEGASPTEAAQAIAARPSPRPKECKAGLDVARAGRAAVRPSSLRPCPAGLEMGFMGHRGDSGRGARPSRHAPPPEAQEAALSGRKGVWVRGRPLSVPEKKAVDAACQAFIAERLKPRFLREIHPTQFNYPIDIRGKWRGSKYGFAIRYRSGFPDNLGEEFDSPFARLDHDEEHLTEARFHVLWRRHTGQWWPFRASVPLEEALDLIESEPLLQPHI